MRKLLILAITLMFAVGWNQILFAGEKEHGGDLLLAGEHGGKEHGGKEHGGTAAKKVSSEQIRAAMKNHVLSNYVDGTFQIKDPKAGKIRKLKLLKVHERVGKTGDYHYSCADFKDTETGELLDLDLDIDNKGGVLSVVDVRIHKDHKENSRPGVRAVRMSSIISSVERVSFHLPDRFSHRLICIDLDRFFRVFIFSAISVIAPLSMTRSSSLLRLRLSTDESRLIFSSTSSGMLRIVIFTIVTLCNYSPRLSSSIRGDVN